MAAQGHFEGQSVNRPPLFDGEDYTYWKTRMEYFLQGHDYQIWSIVEEGDLVVTNEKAQWTDEDRKKISLNCKAKSILCCALSKKEFNRVSACKSSMEMWEKLRITYEGTDKVKETRIDILVTQYERFQMQTGESITQMFSRFTDITNGLASLGKSYENADMVRKILRSLPSSWTAKVTAIEEANDLKRMSVEKLIGSLMAHEINMERLGESSSRKKQSNALKANGDSSEESLDNSEDSKDSDDEEAMLSRRLQRILAKKKKFQSGRRYFKKNKDLKRPDGKDQKRNEPLCYECKKPGHIKADCPMLKKNDHKKKDSSKKFRRFKKKAMAAAWDNSSDSDSESSSSSEGEEANLALMANTEDKVTSDSSFDSCNDSDSDNLESAFNELYDKYKEVCKLLKLSKKNITCLENTNSDLKSENEELEKQIIELKRRNELLCENLKDKNKQIIKLEKQESSDDLRKTVKELNEENNTLASTLEKFTNGKNSLLLKGARRSGKNKRGIGYIPPVNEEEIVYPEKYPTPKFTSEQDVAYKANFKYIERVTITSCCSHCNKLGHLKSTCPTRHKKWIMKVRSNDTDPSGPKRTWVPKA